MREVLLSVRHYIKSMGLDNWLKLPKEKRWEIIEGDIRHKKLIEHLEQISGRYSKNGLA